MDVQSFKLLKKKKREKRYALLHQIGAAMSLAWQEFTRTLINVDSETKAFEHLGV